jgi:tetratricopeptide (TPR) repeat protein
MRRALRLAALLLLLAGLALGGHLWADGHYRAACRALARGDPAEAQRHLALCSRVWFHGAQTRLLQARAARLAGEYDQAETFLRAAEFLGAAPEAVEVERLLRRAQQGELADLEGPLVGRVLRGHPDAARIVEALGPAYLANYQLVQARECARRWVALEPDCARAWLFQAHALERAKDQAGVRESYRRAVELAPDDLDARLALAGCLADFSPREALEQFEYVRARRGDSPALLTGLAHCRVNLGQLDRARPLLDIALAARPDDWAALFERARLAQAAGAATEAEQWFRRAAAVKPYELGILHGLHACLAQVGKRDEAEEVRARLERVKADLGRVAELTRQVASRPRDPGPRCEVGTILMRNGMEAEGLDWLATALQADPRHAATHQALADYYARRGDAERAAEHREAAAAGAFALPPGR